MLHIITWTSHRLGKHYNFNTLPWNTLIDIALVQMYFMFASRPSELLNICSSKTKNGLFIEDVLPLVVLNPKSKKQRINASIIKVRSFKNQISKKHIKEIVIGNTRCKIKECKCQIINPHKLIRWINKRRPKQYKKNRDLFTLAQMNTNPFFVYDNGLPINATKLTDLAAEIAQINQVHKPECYTAYSTRIDGKTCQAAAGVDKLMIKKSVGWALG